MIYEEIQPHRVTKLESVLMGEIEVSSVHYRHLFSPRPENSTVVFFNRDNRNDNKGTYGDHDRVVDEMKQKYNATVKS